MDGGRALDHSSILGGSYEEATSRQVGFLRVVTDFVRFAYLMDVFVTPDHRRRGLARAMVRLAMEQERTALIDTWCLGTEDAQPVYAALGFRVTEDPNRWMFRKRSWFE